MSSVFTKIKDAILVHKTNKDHVRIQLPAIDFINLLQETGTQFTISNSEFIFSFLGLALDLNDKPKVVKVTVNYNNYLNQLVII